MNGELQRKCRQAAEKKGIPFFAPDRKLCGDNGAMIAAAGYYEYLAGTRAGLDLNAYATSEI